MADGTPAFTLSTHRSITEIGADAWDALAGRENPFIRHAFLEVLEESGSVGGRSGWQPLHVALRDGAGGLAGVAPAYVKSHSYGEYVFDQGWAQALERAGGEYYPKLQVAVPFTPVPGPRLLLREDVSAAALGAGLVELARALDLSSVHVTFCGAAEARALVAAGWLAREGMQFHWENRGYADFEAFLAALSSRKRKAIRRERAEAGAGLEIRALRGPEIGAREWEAFWGFYRATVDRKWGGAYLTRRFFPLLGERLGERVVLMMAWQGREPVAGALNLMGADTLYGRNWGCKGDWPFLHFELCYYRAIDFAIAHGLARVEAGAQGMHKIQRGYLPQPTHSAHWIAHPGLARAVAGFLAAERAEVAAERAELATLSPFRRAGAGTEG
ncbi:MAG: GNAT family N-acetyltransferase [Acetobacteraceae bacterium]